MSNTKEDTHFYLDFTPLDEVTNALRVLSPECDHTNKEISDALRDNYSYEMQKDLTYSSEGCLIWTWRSKAGRDLSLSGFLNRAQKFKNLGSDSALAMDLIRNFVLSLDQPTEAF